MEASPSALQSERQIVKSSDASPRSDQRGTPDNVADRTRQKESMAQIKQLEFSREAEIFKALGHPIRLKIVYGLLKLGGCNVKNMQECLGLHQATVSQHLIHLKNRGIITSSRQGLEMVYRVADEWTTALIDNISKYPAADD
ncbi:MAG: ArsR/SmtB family transcription factor [Desulfomonilaceae bacterium]